MGQENYYAVINLPPRLIPEASACLQQRKPLKVLRLMLHQAQVAEIILKNPALAVRRLLQGITHVDPFPVEEREASIAGFHRYAPH